MVGTILATAVALLVLADIGGLLATYRFGHPGVLGLIDLFDLDSEENIPSWYSASVLLICSGALALIAAAKHQADDRFRWHWAGLAAGFLYLSADEEAGIHEVIGPFFAGAGKWLTLHLSPYFRYLAAYPVYTWVLPAIVAAVLIGISYTKFLLALPRRTAVLFVVSAAIFFGGAVGVEVIGARHVLLYGRQDAVYGSLVILEESMEMIGVALFLCVVLRYAQAEIGSIRLQFETPPPASEDSSVPRSSSSTHKHFPNRRSA
jgi:hypothetical protein